MEKLFLAYKIVLQFSFVVRYGVTEIGICMTDAVMLCDA